MACCDGFLSLGLVFAGGIHVIAGVSVHFFLWPIYPMSSFHLRAPAEPLACAMTLTASLEPRVGSPLMFSWTSPSRRLRVEVMPGRMGLGWLHLTTHPTSHQGLWFWSSGGCPPQKQLSFPRGRETKETGLLLSLSAASLSLGARS